jgi:hypothetical protein
MPRTSYLARIREMVDGLSKPPHIIEFVAIKEYIDAVYKRPAHVYSVTKRLINKARQLDEHLKTTVNITFRETQREKLQSDRRAQKALEKRNQSVTYFNPAYILKVIYHCVSAFQEDPVMRFIGLQLACGCRQRDIFDSSICKFFFDSKDLTNVCDERIVQIGQSKRRNTPFHHIRPLIGVTALQFMDCLDTFRLWLRIAFAGMTMEAITSKLNRELSHKTKELFPVDQERAGTHVNRAIYAAMVRYHERFKERNGIKTASAPRAVQQALGHEKMTSSLHYLYVDIHDKGFQQELS